MRVVSGRFFVPAVCIFASLIGENAAWSQQPASVAQPPVCSAEAVRRGELPGICSIGSDPKEIKLNLTAQTSDVVVAGYKVKLENYNGSYLAPIIEADAGHTVLVHLENKLAVPASPPLAEHEEHHHEGNPTNLHIFHGGVVTPNNSRPKDVELGDGDNVYVHLDAGKGFDYRVPIPDKLDARVLDSYGVIPHPPGLNWYHSHMHGRSARQVGGALSGLLSVGHAKANVLAERDEDKEALRDRTDVLYAMLRDIPLRTATHPEQADGDDAAAWEPEPPAAENASPVRNPCLVKRNDQPQPEDASLRKGFCTASNDPNSKWLFTINGQRFPTIRIEGYRNLLLRMGNLSPNVAYWLELKREGGGDGDVLPLTILNLDGVVPAKPVAPDAAKIPVKAFDVNDLLLMPAARVEFYVRNDTRLHDEEQTYILRTKGLNAGSDRWPEIALAKIVLAPNREKSLVVAALNVPVAIGQQMTMSDTVREKSAAPVELKGCLPDLKPGEHRRIAFAGSSSKWTITTETRRLPDPRPAEPVPEYDFVSDADAVLNSVPFEEYMQSSKVDWEGDKHKHVCINFGEQTRHGQLWVLANDTGSLHNFHIHQMKFRLARREELVARGIRPPDKSHTCTEQPCTEPDYRLFDDRPEPLAEWHDTIPMPEGESVFVIMNFDAKEQVGRFVFHCHILKHEDKGLMAPIEVWRPGPASE